METVTIPLLQRMKREGRKSAGVVAWDFPTTRFAERAGADFVSVGDSVGAKSAPFDVAPGGLDQGLWQGITCAELIPSRSKSVVECLDAWLADPKNL